MEATNYKCFISGEKGKHEVHHANAQHTFHAIAQEAIELTGLPIYQKIGQYKTEDLSQLSRTCVELHYKYGLGVPLKPKLHREFHYTYGFTDWTSEDFSEFVEEKRKYYRF